LKDFLLLLIAFLLFHISPIFSQSTYRLGWLPSININKKLQQGWKLNFKTESRFHTITREFSSVEKGELNYRQSDLALVGVKKLGFTNSVALGYLLRLKTNTINHRFIQQFTIVSKYEQFYLAHRFTLDETFDEENPTTIRLRYRLATDFPLNGESVDRGELYLKLSNEYLNALQGNSYDLEIRLVPLLGLAITNKNKLEWGLDYRLNKFVNDVSRSSFWLKVNWYWSL